MDPKELPLIRPRQKRSTSSPCIKWRHQIERHPKATLFWQIFIGIFAFLHFLVSFGILTVIFIQILPGHRKYELSLVPLICLSVEISVLCNTMLGVVIYLLVKRKKGMATWHRSVIGILIRNIFISAAFVITLILSIFYIETTRKSILIHSVSTISAPLIILCIISILKIVFLETSYTWYWLSLNILGLSEIFILIMKEDYDYRISWCVSLTPIWLFFIIHLAFSFTLFTVKSRNIAKLLLVFSMIGSICGSSSIAFLAVFLDGHDNSWDKFMMFGWAALFWFTFAYAYSFGKWAIGTLFCHIEFEFIQSKKRLNLRAKTWEVLL